MKDKELLELCKKVYEKTGWTVGDESWYWHTTTDAKLDSMFIAPKYYTDYLLEKLQSWFYDMGASDFGQFNVTMLADVYIAKVRGHDGEFSEQAAADTPLKALLKLTIALDKAGVKL